MGTFYPEDSLLDSGIPAKQAASIEVPNTQLASKQRKSGEGYDVSAMRKNFTSLQHPRRNDKSPLSLKKIIDKLERTERDEAR